MFGLTAGEINRQIVVDSTGSGLTSPTGTMAATRFYRPFVTPTNVKNKSIFGNNSKKQSTWISGPNTSNAQHVPGYTGHVPGIISENIFSKSYAKCSGTAILKKHPIGFDYQPKVRYTSQQSAEFNPNNFRRYVDNKNLKSKKDYEDYAKYINDQNFEKK